MDMKLELLPMPVADIDRAIAFYVENSDSPWTMIRGRTTPSATSTTWAA
jgi:hypothetical protein